ncbi:MAG TPA: tRNA uridine-5-carboxymethylaminomethyl(34) synthesis GTPase MnmE [Paracoccaceae bacterium]|nr:tRNA uridine-5-carboxymethylaminomethyl(34) synthesis GTPase MnmE [Paracoccaceae bacterium]
MSDTIFALASARGRAGVAVVRVSGPDACRAARELAGDCPAARFASLRNLRDRVGNTLDQGLVIWFPAGASFTGEDVVEFQLHGSSAVVNAVLRSLGELDGLRVTEPGEFTRRALENNRMDLSQVEGLADLIEAETEAQRRQALQVMQGALGDKAAEWRKDLIHALALLEVTIDFVDEDVPVDVTPEVLRLLETVQAGLKAELDGSLASAQIRDGFEVAIVGRPNIGKSTLLNALAGRDAAITSEIAGTTRDVIEVRMDINGLPVTLLDTAGLRESDDIVETLGVERAKKRADEADIRVFLLGAEESADEFGVTVRSGDILALGKADLGGGAGLAVSGKTGQGVDALLEKIAGELEDRIAGASSAIRERHVVALRDAQVALELAATRVLQGSDMVDLASEEMRQALRALDVMIGRVDVENVLDDIFSSFCLGK